MNEREFDELTQKMSALSLADAAALVGELLSRRAINRNQASYLRGIRYIKERAERKESERRRQLKKQSWIDNARSEFIKTQKTPCFVCHNFQPFCHAHHVLPLSIQFDEGFQQANHTHIWLCPTHHDIVHRMLAPIALMSRGKGQIDPELSLWLDRSPDVDLLFSVFKMGTDMLYNATHKGETL